MLEKYFGYSSIQDELSVVDSLIEHTRIDEEELYLLATSIQCLFKGNTRDIETNYAKIIQIRQDSNRIFDHIAEDIIQADFNSQNQYDLLRLYQRIETISDNISSVAKRIIIFVKIGGSYPPELVEITQKIIDTIVSLHAEFKNSLLYYQNDKKLVLKTIHTVINLEELVDDYRVAAIEILYTLANKQELHIGTFRATENILERLENLADSIEEAATSLEWLLI
jgi:uncharacterized protein Yka (UPF0111/DUF47 family)